MYQYHKVSKCKSSSLQASQSHSKREQQEHEKKLYEIVFSKLFSGSCDILLSNSSAAGCPDIKDAEGCRDTAAKGKAGFPEPAPPGMGKRSRIEIFFLLLLLLPWAAPALSAHLGCRSRCEPAAEGNHPRALRTES